MLFGSEDQKQAWLPKLAAGEVIGTFALAERPGTSDPRKLTASVTGGKLTGTKLAVPDGDVADFAVVAVHGGNGSWLHLVNLKDASVSKETVTTIDPTRSHARITFTSSPVDPLPGANSADSVRKLLDYAAVPMAFEQVGGAQAALDMANAYAKERFAFGRPIGSFQGIKHKLADMYIQVEMARSNAYYGAWAVHTDAAELPVAASVARIAACDAGWFCTKENIQTHGGMGFTWQMDCHLYYRRAKLLALALGGSREWKQRLVAELRTRNTQDMQAA
jgi:alkylation response protein AidB-like acyl-CoA dehydrogenase